MYTYLIVTDDGDVYGTNDEDEAKEWDAADAIVIDRAAGTMLWAGEWRQIHEAPTLEEGEDEDTDD